MPQAPHSFSSPLLSQRGAMFGLDARIALAIFAVLAVVAGVYSGMTLSSTYANSLAQEMDETGQAIEAIHHDIEADLHRSLSNPSDKNAFVALYDAEVLEQGRPRARWLGPYIKTTEPTHPRFGEMRITKRGAQVRDDCYPEATCYLWLVYDNVQKGIATEVNQLFDHTETLPELEGRIQWQDGADPQHVILWYRATRTLSGQGYF